MERTLVTILAALVVGMMGCGDDEAGAAGGGGTPGTGGSGGSGAVGGEAGTGGAGGVGARSVSIAFAAKVGDADFECGTMYDDLGSASTTLELVDFRFYVQDVELRNAAGDWVAVELDDTDFQTGAAALLDFEDGCGEFGDPGLNDAVAGTVPEDVYDAIRFQMGVPFDMNHDNPATAPPPMNLTSLHWNWQGGYKFLRVDSGSFMGGGWRMHLGSTACDGDPISGGTTNCDTPNRVDVLLEGFDPESDTVAADARALVAGQDLDNLAPMPPGCMSGPSDPDCTSIFGNLGLPFGGNPAPGSQQFFTIE